MSEILADLAVIGAGPGGYPAAFLAADRGLNVTLIDPELNPGGVCLYRGCIPTKTLLHLTQLLREYPVVADHGIIFTQPEKDLSKMIQFKDSVVNKLTTGLGQLCKQRKINYITGMAAFIDSKTLFVQSSDGTDQKISFKNALIATGSRPASLPLFNIDSSHVLDSTGALEPDSIPERILVVGGGYIGLEMGTIFSSLGSEVSVVELMPQLLPGADPDLVRLYISSAKKLFKDIKLKTKVTKLESADNGVHVTFEDDKGNFSTDVYNKVLLTIGRTPNTSSLNLEKAGVLLNEQGFIKINKRCETSAQNIYAIGDVVGGAMLAHKATHEGKAAIDNITGQTRDFAPKAVPAVLFTDPEIAWAGMTETEAKAQSLNIKTAKFMWAGSGRALSLGRTDGMTKIIADPETDKMLGIGIVGHGAGELIAEGALAIENELTVKDIAHTIHPHPTLSETLMEACEVYYGECPHVFQRGRK